MQKLIHLHNALAQVLDFPGVMGAEFLDLGLVLSFGLRQVVGKFLNLRLLLRFCLREMRVSPLFFTPKT